MVRGLMLDLRRRRGRPVAAAFYFLYFASVGITLPFLPLYLTGLGLRATEVGVLLAFTPAVSLVVPTVWGRMADRARRPSGVLALVSAGSAVCYSPLLFVRAFTALAAVFLVYACFAGAMTPLIDSITLAQLEREGGSFSRVRLFGSLGFVVATTAFGLLSFGASAATIAVPAALLLACGLCAAMLPRQSGGHLVIAAPHLRGNQLKSWEGGLFLFACCLHWIASAPYNGDFSIHVAALGLPSSVVGLAAGSGVLAEVAVMAAYPILARRVSALAMLCASFLASAARWWGMGHARTGPQVVLLTLLHGLTFGAFYIAAVGFIAQRVGPERRAEGQALFASVTFGLGGLVGYLAAGTGYDLVGGRLLFLVAAGVELLAALALFGASFARRSSGGARPC